MASTKLSLRILTGNIGTYSKQPASIETDDEVIQAHTVTPPIPHLQNEYTCLLEGKLTDFLKYSGHENAQWLIDIAHDLCDPRFKRGSLCVCSSNGQNQPVNPSDPLTPSIYEYRTSVVVHITKKSAREGKSRTKSWVNAETMLEALRGREDRCWITKRSKPLAAGHILPKRTGDSEARLIYKEFTGDSAPAGMTALHPEFGILLDLNMEYWFDDYWIGFRLNGNNGYTVHNFTEERISKHGRTWSDRVASGWKDLHGQAITPPNPASPIDPPPGLFRWHYLQCVIRKFSTTDYQNIENIAMYEKSVLMKGDSDDEATDSEADWPSAIFDRGRFAYAQAQLEAERMDAVARWIASA
ncbi:hypothetical protein F5878DRAFT_541775 [Lentinula raphanica]|uniref:Uncharacterized protein n=1 Tax=Lentinula raphanica TaxID=153919 RepID=A0AA38P4K6_9AGAR|nr:hypothetical protein F5878DRAFT_541775 [Lentinula raphanica]